MLGAGVAFAESPELLFVIDGGMVKRFDPISGTYFGSFGGLQLTFPLGIEVSAKGIVFVSDYLGGNRTAVRMFNGFTGNYLGQLGATTANKLITGLTLGPDGFLYGAYTSDASGSGGLAKIDLTTGGQTFTAAPGANFPTDVAYGLSAIFLQDGTKYHNFSQAGAYNATFPNSGPTTGSEWLCFRQDRSGWFQGASNPVYGVVTAISNGIYGSSTTKLVTTSLSSISDMDLGHSNYYVSGLNAAGTAGLLQTIDLANNTPLGTFGAGNLTSPGAMAVWTAPEPTSLLALGGAALVLARRRRAK